MQYHDNYQREGLEIQKSHTIDWYKLDIEKIYKKLRTRKEGLNDREIQERQIEFGKNELPPQEPPTLFTVFLHQLKSPLIYILLMAGLVALLINDITDAVFIFAIILLNSILGTYQEFRAEKSAAALQNMIKIYARVKRNGSEALVSSTELVPGDIVLLESGDKVPADMRLSAVNNLSIDESFLTGESKPINKSRENIKKDTIMSDRENIAYAGSTIMSGRGEGIVFATGLNTEVGKIANSVIISDSTKPPLVQRMEKFSKNISIIVIGACILLSIIAISKQIPYAEIIFMAVALAVSAIPEGLPVALTVALSIGTSRMSEKNVIVRKLTAVEGLGSCTFIASDKTGTLTLNKQLVRLAMLPNGNRFSIKGDEISGEGEIVPQEGICLHDKNGDMMKKIAKISSICNEGHLKKEKDKWTYRGDSVDIALLAFAYKTGIDIAKIRKNIVTLADIPYESENRLAAKLYKEDDRTLIAVKGSAETILPLCNRMNDINGEIPLDRKQMDDLSESMSADGYRVLAIAYSILEEPIREDEFTLESLKDLVFCGFAGMIDPLRPDAQTAVKEALNAGVNVAMVTGDHPATALAISRELGIAEKDSKVITGADLEEMGSPDIPEFLEEIRDTRVFARVTPLQKLEIVEGLLRLGHFVAVTGDGVNDAPALKRASIGVAMGSGTEVTKETADIIITDDKFSSIVSGIKEGRIAYDNIRKVIYLLLSTGFAEILLFILAIITGLKLPLLAVQILWLNLVTNGIQDIALAFERGEPGIMKRKPKEPGEGIFNKQMISQVILSGGIIGIIVFFVWDYALGIYSEVTARSIVLMLMVLMQNVHLFNCRSEKQSTFMIPLKNNYILLLGLFLAHFIHVLASYMPFMQNILNIEPISLVKWSYLLMISLILLFIMEIYKYLLNIGSKTFKKRLEQAS